MLHKLLNFPDCSASLLLFLRRSEDGDLYYFSSFSVSNHVTSSAAVIHFKEGF